MSDRAVHDECGVVGVFNHPEAANLTYLGLYCLQHRGQESAGIVASQHGRFSVHRGAGLVGEVFGKKALKRLKGSIAIGHVRYSTTGSSIAANVQPCVATYWGGEMAVAHNGNITNAHQLRTELEQQGAIFNTSMDTELAIHLVANARRQNFTDAFIEALRRFQGAYSMVALHDDALIAARDPRGFRPLALGRVGDAWVVASETCAFDIISAEFVRELEPGEVIVIDKDGVHSRQPFTHMAPKLCIFEYVYVSRPDSELNGHSIYTKRLEMGRRLALEHPAEAELVLPVPDSSNPAALGYAEQSTIPFQNALIRSHYIGRTFIEPDQRIRDFGAKIKYNAVRALLEGKRVVAVDDSIVRGATSRKIVKMLRDAGAAEVHMRVSSPPWKHPCFYGIDTPSEEELIGSHNSVEEIRQYIAADSLGYISLDGLTGIFDNPDHYCHACFDGKYPGGHPGQLTKNILENNHA